MNNGDSPSSKKKPSPKAVQNYVFAIILVALFLVVCRLFAPFFTVLLWSTLFYILLSPLHHRIVRNIDFSKTRGTLLRNFWAAVFALGTVVIILLPLFFMASQFLRQVMDLIRTARYLFSANPGTLTDIFERLSALIRDLTSDQIVISAGDIQRRILSALSLSLQTMIQMSSSLARNIGSFLLSLVLMVFCLFFFYMDGTYLSRLLLHVIPIRKEYISALVGKFKDITRNLFFGYIIVAIVQAVMAYIIFTIFRVKGALVFAGLTLVSVFIPIFGGGLIWLPLGIVRIINGNVIGGVVFLIVSGIFISTLDNFLRPMFLQNRIQLHPLIIFFAILGGMRAFGFNGFVLGPMVVILFLTVLDLFLTEHKIEHD
ncbi:MAG: AI-2E family transporter [Treponema sp.]|jgi:predicted PurR-regulated permease PerM|nr:AI-2E family transporter [Treponema sp.]